MFVMWHIQRAIRTKTKRVWIIWKILFHVIYFQEGQSVCEIRQNLVLECALGQVQGMCPKQYGNLALTVLRLGLVPPSLPV